MCGAFLSVGVHNVKVSVLLFLDNNAIMLQVEMFPKVSGQRVWQTTMSCHEGDTEGSEDNSVYSYSNNVGRKHDD